MINIDPEKCIKCGLCVSDCPAKVIEEKDEVVQPVHADACISCYHCVAICPKAAVTCDEFPLEAFKPASELKPAEYKELRDLFFSRRSVRVFKDKLVPRELLEELIEIGSRAPTGSNAQFVELTIITNRELINELDGRIMKVFGKLIKIVNHPVGTVGAKIIAPDQADRLSKYISSFKRFSKLEGEAALQVFHGAPVLVLAHLKPGATTGKDDCVIALDQMMLAANALGLGATWIGMLLGAVKLSPSLKKPLGVPKGNTLHAAMILGWPRHEYKRAIPRKTFPVKWIE